MFSMFWHSFLSARWRPDARRQHPYLLITQVVPDHSFWHFTISSRTFCSPGLLFAILKAELRSGHTDTFCDKRHVIFGGNWFLFESKMNWKESECSPDCKLWLEQVWQWYHEGGRVLLPHHLLWNLLFRKKQVKDKLNSKWVALLW